MPKRVRNFEFQNDRGDSVSRFHNIEDCSIKLSNKCILSFESVVTKENLYKAWNDFVRGKRHRADVSTFALKLTDNLSELYEVLSSGAYKHGPYEEYLIFDPKKRFIHKASVQDRIVHRLIYSALYLYFDRRFIYDSYSCRKGKGVHIARKKFRCFSNIVSENYTKSCYILKFDIQKCFASIDRVVLKNILKSHICDQKLLGLVEGVVNSSVAGLPLGNLTSQLFVNIYLHEFDYFVKQKLKAPYYLRYADDVAVVCSSRRKLIQQYKSAQTFLKNQLLLNTHKVEIKSLYGGVDILGEVFFAKYKRLRRSTEQRLKTRKRVVI